MVLGHEIFKSVRTQDVKISENVSFDSMFLTPNTLEGLKTSGFYVPSPIQLHGIPLGKCGFDLILEAKSGTGKTAVFTVVTLEKLNLNKGVQTLVLAPTREIASQISDVIKAIGVHFEGLCVEVVMGGLPVEEDIEKFQNNVHIIVGSPGRLSHLIREKYIDVSSVRLIVLDEADKLVEKCFIKDVNFIFSLLPKQKQVIMSSATYPHNVRTTINNYVQNAHYICPDSNSVLLGIDQNVVLVKGHVNIVKQTKNRYEELDQILSKNQFKQCLVFCNYQVRVGEVHRMLTLDNWPADKLHGHQEQTDRLEALKILQNYECRILVATDLAARGIDASNINLVINFEIPRDWQTYLHRIGRAGRFGSYGSAITILCEGQEEKNFKKLLSSIKIPFNLKNLWSREPFLLNTPIDVEVHQKEVPQPNIEEAINKLGIKETYEELWKMLSVDTTETEDIHDYPTFESLCNSFEQANQPPISDKIELFSDLLSSFQNHEIKCKKYIYKPVAMNKLIIPSMVFNSNIVLQSLQKDSNMLLEEKNIVKQFISKIDNKLESNNNEIKAISNQPSNTKHDNAVRNRISRPKTRDDVNGTSDNDNLESRRNNNASGSKNHQSGTVDDINHTTASGSSKYITDSIKTGGTSHLQHGFSTNNDSKKIIDKDQESMLLNGNVKVDINDATPHKSRYNQNLSEYNEDERSLFSANLPTAFGKSSKRNSTKSNKQNISFCKSHFSKDNPIIRNSVQAQLPQNQTEPLNERDSDLSLDNEKAGEYRSLKDRNNSKNHTTDSKMCKHVHNSKRTNECNNSNSYSNNETEVRQHQFNIWYRQLQAHKQMIERAVYNEVMSNSSYY